VALARSLLGAIAGSSATAAGTLDIRNTLTSRIRELTPAEFESLLRPAFHQQDEWISIAVGAALGFLVGGCRCSMLHH